MAEFNPEKIKSDQIHNGLQYMLGDALSADDVNAIVEGLLYLSGFSGEVNFGKLLKATKANFGIVTSDSAEIGALSVNTLQSELQKALAVGDNILVVNAYGEENTVSGIVVAKSSDVIEGTQTAYPAYGLLYDPVTNAMCVGDVTVLESDSDTGHEVTYNPETLIPLAARDGLFLNDEIPIWDAIKNAFVPSGIKKSDIGAGGGGITEWDYEITDPLKFTKLNLSQMSGNVLVKNCGTVASGSEIDIPSSITTLKFVNTKVDGILIGGGNTTIIGYAPADKITYNSAIRNFGKVENASGSAQIVNCKHISNSELWIANGCSFISDCTTIVGTHDSYTAVFENCKHIHGISVLDRNSKVEFKGCSFISNVSSDLSADGVITYTNCKYVDALTCVGYGVGVPYVDANGTVSFLTNAEGGSYGS